MEKLLGEPITDQILSEVTFVHRANLRNDGRVTETDYLLFKLLQLQKVDVAVLEKLVDRYHALDVDNSGTVCGEEIRALLCVPTDFCARSQCSLVLAPPVQGSR